MFLKLGWIFINFNLYTTNHLPPTDNATRTTAIRAIVIYRIMMFTYANRIRSSIINRSVKYIFELHLIILNNLFSSAYKYTILGNSLDEKN